MSAVGRYIANTWRGKPTDEELPAESMMFACLHNAKEAERLEDAKRALIPTAEGEYRMELILASRTAYHDKLHWREYAEYYKGRVAKEGSK